MNKLKAKLKSKFACCLIGMIGLIVAGAHHIPASANESTATGAEAMTQHALDLCKQGKIADALDAQRKAVAENPTSSLAHASMSYLAWRQGDSLGALNEGETAVKLDSDRLVYLINLAIMMQDSEGFKEAKSLYTRAHKLAPDNWVPNIGIARCDILLGDQAGGNAALRAMADQPGRNFEWYYMTAKTAMENEKPSTAEIAVKKALSVAKTEQEKGAASSISLLAALRAKNVSQAREQFNSAIANNPPKSGEIYVRAASMLLNVGAPQDGKRLLDCAIENIKGAQDSDTFLKLGRLFEEKTLDKTCDAECKRHWLDNARGAYANAALMRNTVPVYHLALGTVLYHLGLNADAAAEFKKVSSLDPAELLPAFLATKLLTPAATQTSASTPELALSRVRFQIDGLSCGCKLSKLRATLRESGVVVFVNTPPEKPYVGQMLVHGSIDVDKLLQQTELIAIPHPPSTAGAPPPDNLKLKVLSKEPVASIDEAIKAAESVAFGPILEFGNTYAEIVNRYKEVRPVVPISDSTTSADIDSGSAWRIQL